MKAALTILVLLAGTFCCAETLKVEVVATHSVTRNDRSGVAIADKAVMGASLIDRQQESFNLDTVINGQHVLLACDDSKGCESPSAGTYSAEVKRGKFVHMTFAVPLAEKPITRWYKIAGSW